MKRVFLFFLILSIPLFSQADPKEKLIGVWKFDLPSLVQDPNIQKIKDPAQREQTLKMMNKIMGEMSLEFKKDTQFSVNLGETKQKGNYQILKVEGESLFLKTSIKAEKKGEKAEERVEEIKVEVLGEKIRITGKDKRAFTFIRAKKGSTPKPELKPVPKP